MFSKVKGSLKTPRRKSVKNIKNNSKLLNESLFNKTPSSLLRRTSIELVRRSIYNAQKHNINHRKNYIGDRFIGHRGAMNFDKLDDMTFCDFENMTENDATDQSMAVQNLIDKVVLKPNNRLIKHNMNQRSPSMNERMNQFLKQRKIKNPVVIEHPEQLENQFDIELERYRMSDKINLDFSNNGMLAIGVGEIVIIWNEFNKSSVNLSTYQEENKFVSCVKWLGSCDNSNLQMIAVSSNLGDIDIWEFGNMVTKKVKNEMQVNSWKQLKRQISISGDDADKQINAISYNNKILSVGSVSGKVEHHNIQLNSSLKAVTLFHEKEILQMEPSPDLKFLAMASLDGSVSVWRYNVFGAKKPKAHFQENQCGINAISWDPRNANHLAFTSGENNEKIKIIDINAGNYIRSITTKAEITYLHWSTLRTQIVTILSYEQDETVKFVFWDDKYLDKKREIKERFDLCSLAASRSGRFATVDTSGFINIWKFFHIQKQKESYLDSSSQFSGRRL